MHGTARSTGARGAHRRTSRVLGGMAMGMEGDSNTPLGALVSFLAAEQPAGAALRGGTALVVLAAISVRCAIGLHPYSGMGKPPMFGDFEAQRHWMELTTSLPLADWYRETEQNDLQYWGLDYPPLTAYHSWVCGKVLGWLDPASMELATSRGYETPDHKTAMRAAVLVGDVLLFFPAVFAFVSSFYRGASNRDRLWIAAAVLMQPPLLLIDHGHFQFNAISLGLHGFGLALLVKSSGSGKREGSGLADMMATVLICLGVNYKQMSLYLVWPPFIFLLAKNLYGPRPLVGIALLAVSAIGTFVVCWLPFLVQPDPMTAAGHVIGRQFPFGRGLYEDKVANVWCSISLVLKLKQLLDPSTLIKLCVATTLASMLPSTVLLARRPNATNLMAASVCCALSFFLFSYQVHEKSILLPLLPAGLLFGHSPFATSWFITVGAFSMYPLLEKDGLTLAYVATVVGFNLLIAPSSCGGWRYFEKGRLLSLVGMIAIHAMAVLVPAPARYPDVHTYAFTVYSCAHFLGFYCYWLLIQWQAASLPESQVKAAASKNGLRIGFIHPDLGIGGAERLVVDAAVGLQKAGHSITMYTAHHDPGHSFEETHDGTLEVVVYGDWLPRSLCGTGKCMALCAYLRVFYVSVRVLLNYGPFGSPNDRYDALFVDQVSHSVPMLKAIGGESLKVVFYCHYPDYLLTPRLSCIKSLYRAPLDWAEEQSTGAADAILVNSEFTAQTFAQAFPSLHRRGIKPGVLYPAINLAQQELPSDAEKPDLSFGGAKHVVISINRYERKKNIGLAIMAVGALPQAQRKSLALVIAGGYDTRVTENVEVDLELKEMAEKHGVAEITHFMRNISNVEKLSLLQRATCLMYTPDREHFGIVPVEAMYAKCPVIAVNSGGPLESIDEGVTGFLRPQEPEAWAQATTKLLADPVAQKAMGEAGRKRAVAMFSLESFANCLDSQIRGLVQQQQAGREKTEPDQSQGPDGSAVGTAQSPVASRTRGARRRSTATGSK